MYWILPTFHLYSRSVTLLLLLKIWFSGGVWEGGWLLLRRCSTVSAGQGENDCHAPFAQVSASQSKGEVRQVMLDIRSFGCNVWTVQQYLDLRSFAFHTQVLSRPVMSCHVSSVDNFCGMKWRLLVLDRKKDLHEIHGADIREGKRKIGRERMYARALTLTALFFFSYHDVDDFIATVEFNIVFPLIIFSIITNCSALL